MEFKLQFLVRLSSKSRFQTLRGCGNECKRGWNREIWEGRCLNRSIGLISNLNALQIARTCLFIGYLGVTIRLKWSTVTMERSIVDRFKNVAAVGSWMEHPDEAFDMQYKMPWSHPLNRDPMVEMHRGGSNHDRYNSFLFDTCADDDQWFACPLHQRALIVIQHLAFSHVTCILKIPCGT